MQFVYLLVALFASIFHCRAQEFTTVSRVCDGDTAPDGTFPPGASDIIQVDEAAKSYCIGSADTVTWHAFACPGSTAGSSFWVDSAQLSQDQKYFCTDGAHEYFAVNKKGLPAHTTGRCVEAMCSHPSDNKEAGSTATDTRFQLCLRDPSSVRPQILNYVDREGRLNVIAFLGSREALANVTWASDVECDISVARFPPGVSVCDTSLELDEEVSICRVKAPKLGTKEYTFNYNQGLSITFNATVPPPTTAPPPQPTGVNNLSDGAIGGIAAGCVAVVSVIIFSVVLLVFCIMLYKTSKNFRKFMKRIFPIINDTNATVHEDGVPDPERNGGLPLHPVNDGPPNGHAVPEARNDDSSSLTSHTDQAEEEEKDDELNDLTPITGVPNYERAFSTNSQQSQDAPPIP